MLLAPKISWVHTACDRLWVEEIRRHVLYFWSAKLPGLRCCSQVIRVPCSSSGCCRRRYRYDSVLQLYNDAVRVPVQLRCQCCDLRCCTIYNAVQLSCQYCTTMLYGCNIGSMMSQVRQLHCLWRIVNGISNTEMEFSSEKMEFFSTKWNFYIWRSALYVYILPYCMADNGFPRSLECANRLGATVTTVVTHVLY